MENTLLVGTENTDTYYKRYKTKLGRPFEDMDKLFVHWLDNHFGTDCCFDQRFLKNHIADIDVETGQSERKISFALHPIFDVVDGEQKAEIYTDLRIVVCLSGSSCIKEWMIGFNKLAFDFDPIEAIQTNMMQAKLIASDSKFGELGFGAS
ncbi:MAG: hypothetical protein COB78_12710 [Hyphomicrobiales bacterium]|nr:MAG: hypothetical protein COB78_12710 [Hyphomicrobiales bacterium]